MTTVYAPDQPQSMAVRPPVPLPILVSGSGIHLPETVVTNADLTRTLDTSAEWIVSRTGIRERRRLAPELAVSDMCVAAAPAALAEAGISPRDLDAVIIATYTYDQPLPSTALMVKERIGADRALPIDITQAACANGLQAILLAAHLLQVSARAVLVVAADCASRITDPRNRTTGVFFGDAAGAVVLTRTETPGAGLLSWDFGSQLSHDVEIRAGGSRLPTSAQTVADREHYLRMDGRAVWAAATTRLPQSIRAATDRAGLPVTEIDHFFLHQANLNILTAAMTELEVPMQRAPVTLDTLGNTGSAGVLTALHQARTDHRIQPGDSFILSAIGAGFQWGTLCFRQG
ncbi:MAG: 3-oxoacyl-[acyl-carrier-protein] synthase 3 [Nocardia sp.]|uniref:3-oxoacyl-ACP synthase III family protein n=1 Tax=Nocardia sp. TaxID=1821 RepID=UPI002613A844|nr:beta-ketoacyl-ACP synthase 3 [Nocardia sp.]MCU1647713.1 3-oxoacyl-[acyl-carrier-protein] synthase 3 [Nocardia sp.]